MSSVEKIGNISSAEIVPLQVTTNSVPVPEVSLSGEQPSEETGMDVTSLSNTTEQIIDDNGDVHTYIRNASGVTIEYKLEHTDNSAEHFYYDDNGNVKQNDTLFSDGKRIENHYYDDCNELIYIGADGKITKKIVYYNDGSEKEKTYDSEGNRLKVTHRKGDIVVERDCTAPVSDVVTGKKNEEEYLTGFYDKENNLTYLRKNVNGEEFVYELSDLKYLSHETKRNLVLTPNMIIGKKLSDDIKMVQCAEAEALKAGSEGSAEYKKAYDSYIRSQMIKTPDNMEDIPGEIVEKDGKLFVNAGKSSDNDESNLVELKISPEKYLDLFPPIKRYDINQNNVGDCYFIAPAANIFQRPKGFIKILQMFSEDENGNITLSISNKYNRRNQPVVFPNGEPFNVDCKVGEYEYPVGEYRSGLDGAKGIQMLEQAFAINRYADAHDHQYPIESIDIDLALHEEIDGGYPGQTYFDVFGLWGFNEKNRYYTTPKYFDSLADKINNDERVYSFDFKNDETLDVNLISNHVYSIESVDRIKRLIYLINPHSAGCSIVLPYEDLTKSCGTEDYQRNISTALF